MFDWVGVVSRGGYGLMMMTLGIDKVGEGDVGILHWHCIPTAFVAYMATWMYNKDDGWRHSILNE